MDLCYNSTTAYTIHKHTHNAHNISNISMYTLYGGMSALNEWITETEARRTPNSINRIESLKMVISNNKQMNDLSSDDPIMSRKFVFFFFFFFIF